MKKLSLALIMLFLTANLSYSQFKDKEMTSLNKSTNNLILGIFNPKNFTMKHSFEVSMLSSSYGSVSVTSYVNSMNYKISDRMNISADVRLQYSPYASSRFGQEYSTQLQNDLSGLSLSRVAFDYKISENSYLKFEYRNLKGGYYDNYYNPFYNDEFLDR